VRWLRRPSRSDPYETLAEVKARMAQRARRAGAKP
jgi:hypothetical protein